MHGYIFFKFASDLGQKNGTYSKHSEVLEISSNFGNIVA
jgi:hypothetical protein